MDLLLLVGTQPWDKPGVWTLVRVGTQGTGHICQPENYTTNVDSPLLHALVLFLLVGAQSRDKSSVWHSVMENIAAEIAFHLAYAPVFFLLVGAQMQDVP